MEYRCRIQRHPLQKPDRFFMCGFTMLELVVVIAIIGILLAFAAHRLLPYIDEAERISVLRLEGQLRSSLMMEAAGRIVRGQSASIADLEGSNPIVLLLEPPKNYLGELTADRAAGARAGHWYFEPQSQRLIYRPGLPFGISASDEPLEYPAFSVRVEFADRDASGTFDASWDELHGIRRVRVAGGRWLSRVMTY